MGLIEITAAYLLGRSAGQRERNDDAPGYMTRQQARALSELYFEKLENEVKERREKRNGQKRPEYRYPGWP